MRFFRCIIIISTEYAEQSIFSVVLYIFLTLKFVSIHYRQRTFFQHIQNTSHHETDYRGGYIFRAASIILKGNLPLEAATFL